VVVEPEEFSLRRVSTFRQERRLLWWALAVRGLLTPQVDTAERLADSGRTTALVVVVVPSLRSLELLVDRAVVAARERAQEGLLLRAKGISAAQGQVRALAVAAVLALLDLTALVA
jgi:hypothetical protein